MPKSDPAPKAMAILFDSSMSLLPSQFGEALKDRHLVFAGQDFDMHLKISETGGNNKLHGQVIPHRPRNTAPQSSTVTLLAHGKQVGQSATDQFGEFILPGIPIGDLVLEVITVDRRNTASFSV
jgi:hypothetical protein